MKKWWLNLILRLSTRIYKGKEKMIIATPFGTVLLGIYVVILDILLFLIAWPTYFMVDMKVDEGVKESSINLKKTTSKEKNLVKEDEEIETSEKDIEITGKERGEVEIAGDQDVIIKIKLNKLLDNVHKVCLGNNCYYRWHENIFSKLVHWAILFIVALIVVLVLVYEFLIINPFSVSAEATAQLLPIADGTNDTKEWATSGGVACDVTNCYVEVDDSSGASCTNSDGDTSYIRTNKLSSQTFDIDESSIPDGSTVTQIAITVCHKETLGTPTFQTRYCINGSCTDSGITITSIASYTETTQNIPVNFTKTSSSDIEIGVDTTVAGEQRLSKISAVITYTPSADITAPDAITDLSASNPTGTSIDLTWTAPGDDGDTGTAASYDIRYSTSVINDGNWGSATEVSGEPTPSIAGTSESMTVSGLTGETTYYFAIKTSDEVPNESGLSNVVSLATVDTTAPNAISDLLASGASQTTINLSWTAPGDDGDTGTATSYDIRYSTSVINDGNWGSATEVSGEPTPSIAGTSESMTVTNLSSGTTYYFAIKTTDNSSNESNISNIVSFATETVPEVSSGGGGLTLPTVFPLRIPEGGFSILINNGGKETTSRNVTLKLNGGPDPDTMGISMFEDLRDAVGEPYLPTKAWDLCSRSGGKIINEECPDGEYTVYAQFYGVLGQKTEVVSSTIVKVIEMLKEEEIIIEEDTESLLVEEETIESEEKQGQESVEIPPVEEVVEEVVEEPKEEIIQEIIKEVIPVRVIETPKIIEEVVQATEEPTIVKPRLQEIKREVVKNEINFSGFGEPGTKVVLFIHSEQFIIHTAEVDGSGFWKIIHSQDDVTLAPGRHTVYALTLSGDKRSSAVKLESFDVEINYIALVFKYFDLPTTILTIFVAFLSFIFFLFKKR